MAEPLSTLPLRLAARLPLSLLHRIGWLVGWLLYRLPNRQRRIAQTNLERCFPELEPAARRRLLRQSLVETARTGLEMGLFWYAEPERVFALLREVHGAEAVAAALAGGKGVIIAAPHFGAWELVGLYCGRQHAITSLYRRPRKVEFDAPVRAARERVGAHLVATGASGVRALHAALQRGGMIGILPDQDPRDGAGVFAPFFGIPAKSMTLLSRLAARSGAAVFLTTAERLPDAAGFRLDFERLPEAVGDVDAEQAALALNQALEQRVRRQPAQYQWCYKRFRSQPEGGARFYR